MEIEQKGNDYVKKRQIMYEHGFGTQVVSFSLPRMYLCVVCGSGAHFDGWISTYIKKK